MEAHTPFNRPTVLGQELANIAAAIASGRLSGDGDFTKRCHRLLEVRLGGPKVLLTHSCTAALEMAAMLCELGPGDEVVMPSYTFVSTANAVVLRGAVPVFVDVNPHTINIEAGTIEAAITPHTKAIFVVHYAGIPCDMDPINALAARHGLMVVEDAAQALGSLYKGRPAGALGQLAAFSFHETKNVISGEGGALAINDACLVERAEILREKGTDRSRFFRGQVDKYTWVDIGSSYLPSELVAAFLATQLEATDAINADRLESWRFYHDALAPLEAAGRLTRPRVPNFAQGNGHIYYCLLREGIDRDAVLAAMRAAGVDPTFHYVPLHSSPAGRRFGRTNGPLPVTDAIAERLIRLPLFYGIGAARERVVEVLAAAVAA